MKIRKLEIKGLRGVRDELVLDLSSQSALIYGDNGAGKSTIADAIEWFYTDKVEHLKGEEIGRSGLEALRHIDLPENHPAGASVFLSDTSLDSDKTLKIQGTQLKAAYSNASDDFKGYIDQSRNENLVLRYRDLTKFILATKTERLESLSTIIGYKDITTTLAVLKSAFNTVQRDIKTRDFPRIIGEQDQEIIDQYGQNVTSDEQFLEVTNSIFKKAKYDETVCSLPDVNVVLKKIGKPDNANVKKEDFLNRVTNQLSSLTASLKEIEEQYIDFFEKFSAIISDVSKFRKLLLDKVLSTATDLLGNEAYAVDECPVCLTEKDRAQLKTEVDKRISELSEIQAEQKDLSETATSISRGVTKLESSLTSLLGDEQTNEDWFSELKRNIQSIIAAVRKYDAAIEIQPAVDAKPMEAAELSVSKQTTDDLFNLAKKLRDEVREVLQADTSMEVYNKINIAGRAYASIRTLNAEKTKLEEQRDTLEVFYQEFSEKQRAALQSFLDTFSGSIQAIYQFMNPDMNIDNIKLVPLEKNDEMVGMTLQMDFHDHKDISPPHKYLSESHLNCIGIAFFIASAEAFNKRNKFLVLDDVISSFDENHRKRFGDFLIEKCSKNQIIALTHEKSWFELLKNQARGKNWVVNAVKYSKEKGTELKSPPKQLRETIEAKIKKNDAESLASLSRKYLEGLLKMIAKNLEVRVAFRFNDSNEDRMVGELLPELKSHLKRRECGELQGADVIGRLQASTFIGNKGSHDSGYAPGFADAKAFWDDVCEFEALFQCNSCGTLISTRYVDKVEQKIRCKAGELSYSWKE